MPKRKSPNPADESTSLQDGEEPSKQRDKIKKTKKGDKNDKSSAVAASTLPSKEYLAEGSEHIYRTHTCPICRRCFKMRSHLQEHLHLHFPDPSLQCPTCKRHFASKSKLRIHRLREAGEKLHRCHLCEYSAVEKNAIRRHLNSMHADAEGDVVNGPSFLCPACGLNFGQSRALKAHMKSHNTADNKPLTCFHQGCSFQSSLRKDLIRHAAEVHGVTAVECRHHACGAVFQSDTDMESHYRTHLAYHCSECDFSCSNKSVFLQHRRLGHAGSEKLCCDFCSFITFNPVEFQRHIGHLHANEKIHRCPQCSYVTSHKRGLTRHMLMHSGEKPHKCRLCDFRCRDESYLSKHMLTHSEDKNYMCAECGYVTKWKHYLNVHMRKHAGDLRYSCDRCPYRCHRMDQLNSHKLRHQAKSLICEICAYACKRKYELRNHMMAKHSREQKQPVVYKCKYCSYTSCYRQALQNHENCKHTKLKEFRCALCSYSSFSSISFFLHKRKTHGYVPGDKAWLDNYAAKEKERNSTELTQDFYIKKSIGHKQFEQSNSEPSENQIQQSASSSPDPTKEGVAGSQPDDSVEVFDVVSQEIVNEAPSKSPAPINSPEEYCTLVLTTLSSNPSLQNEEEKAANTEDVIEIPSDEAPVQEKGDFSTTASSIGDDYAALPECEHSDLEESYEPPNDRSPCVKSVENQTETSEVENKSEKISPAFLLEQNQSSQSESRLKAMKKCDKDQVETMVLEGRVQMLVLPAEDVFRCDKCSFVACKETALKQHCQSSCGSRTKRNQCEACGEQFQQKRGLDSHQKKKCPALPRKTSIFTGRSNTCSTTQKALSQVEGSEKLDGRTNPEEIPSQNTFTSVKDCSQENNIFKSSLTNPKCANDSEQQGKNPINELQEQTAASSEKPQNVLLQKTCLYAKKDGKFQCKQCSFSSVRLTTVERHLSTCRKSLKKNQSHLVSEADDVGREDKEDMIEEANESQKELSKKHPILKCSSCEFRCSQKRALDRHEKKGCMKPGEVQCTMCSFIAKSNTSLSRHCLIVHKKDKFGAAKAKQMHCKHCPFSCKQERRMAQHVALKHKGTRPHQCRYCPFSTTRRYRLEEHESLHTGVGRHTCDLCDKTFGAVTKLRQHKIRIHDKQPTQFCTLCDFSSYTLDDVRRHNVRCHTGELQHICTHCEARFSSEVALRNHCKRVHQLQACFSCKQCDYTCSSDVTLKAHQQNKHPQVKCTTCQELFDTKESLALHQRSHLTHQCQLCVFAAKTKQLLAQHLLSEHEEGPPEEKPLKCHTCQFACWHQLVLELHLRSHGSKRLYKCTDCKYSTRNKQKIMWHIRIHTGEKPYSCEQCSYSCTDPSRLKLHMRVHQEEKKYLCPECGYKCKWATQLKYHMTKHTGEKPYVCSECDYRTNRVDALRAHRDTQHSDSRPYVCEKCGKAFKTSFILKTHQRQHSDGRPYTCGLCQKAFRWPAGLRHHYLSHTQQQPFSCRHCSYTAKQKFQVVKHLRRHHPEESAEQGVVRDSHAGSLTLKEALQGTLGKEAVEGKANEQTRATEEKEESGGSKAKTVTIQD